MARKDTAEKTAGVWIFQCDPDLFDLDGYLARGSGRLTWEVNQHADEIADGDTVYLWRSVGRATRAVAAAAAAKPYSQAARQSRLAMRPGVVARANVVGSAFSGVDESDAAEFHRDLALPETKTRVWLQIQDHANGRECVRREWLMNDPECHTMAILDRPPDTNIRLTPVEAARLARLWERTGAPMTYDDCVAVLQCYSQIRAADPGAGQKRTWSTGAPRMNDKQARAQIDRAIADTALLIGRATGGVKLAIAKYRAIDPAWPGSGLDGATSVYRDVFRKFWDADGKRLLTADIDAEVNTVWRGGAADGMLL